MEGGATRHGQSALPVGRARLLARPRTSRRDSRTYRTKTSRIDCACDEARGRCGSGRGQSGAAGGRAAGEGGGAKRGQGGPRRRSGGGRPLGEGEREGQRDGRARDEAEKSQADLVLCRACEGGAGSRGGWECEGRGRPASQERRPTSEEVVPRRGFGRLGWVGGGRRARAARVSLSPSLLPWLELSLPLSAVPPRPVLDAPARAPPGQSPSLSARPPSPLGWPPRSCPAGRHLQRSCCLKGNLASTQAGGEGRLGRSSGAHLSPLPLSGADPSPLPRARSRSTPPPSASSPAARSPPPTPTAQARRRSAGPPLARRSTPL